MFLRSLLTLCNEPSASLTREVDPKPAQCDSEAVPKTYQEVDVGNTPKPPRDPPLECHPTEINNCSSFSDRREATRIAIAKWRRCGPTVQARLDHVHGGGHGPGQRPGTATGHQHARDICGESARAPRLEAAPGRLGRVGQAPEAGPPGREGALGSCHPCDLSTATRSRPVLTRVGGHEHPTWGPRGQRGLDPSPLQAAMPAGLTTPLHTLTCTIPGPRPPCSPGRLWPAGVSHSQRVAYERK